MKIRLVFLLGVILVIAGCVRPRSYYSDGTVRSVWMGKCYISGCDYTVVFETDDGQLSSLPLFLRAAPPVWIGLHCEIAYGERSSDDGEFNSFSIVRRLP